MDQDRARRLFDALAASNPEPRTELRHQNPFELLVATILSAQCTDERVNQVTAVLFQQGPDPRALAELDLAELEALVKPTGFYRNKARAVRDCSRALVEDYGGRVPETLEELVRLPGVGRKTANLILGECFGKPGVVVDTHVRRTAARLGLTTESDAEKVERDLQAWIAPEDWYPASSRLLLHGRYVCVARAPRCPECALRPWCDFATSG